MQERVSDHLSPRCEGQQSRREEEALSIDDEIERQQSPRAPGMGHLPRISIATDKDSIWSKLESLYNSVRAQGSLLIFYIAEFSSPFKSNHDAWSCHLKRGVHAHEWPPRTNVPSSKPPHKKGDEIPIESLACIYPPWIPMDPQGSIMAMSAATPYVLALARDLLEWRETTRCPLFSGWTRFNLPVLHVLLPEIVCKTIDRLAVPCLNEAHAC